MAETPPTPTLPTFSWIGHLKDDDRELLSSYGEFFPGHPGNVVIEEGVVQRQVFVVISGELEVYAVDEEGNQVLRARVGPGETLGEINLFDPGPAQASVVVSEFSQLWRIDDDDLIHFMEDNPGAGNVLLRTLATILAQRLRQLDPAAFGMSAYAVVDSPELEEQDATVADPTRSGSLDLEEEATALPVIPLPATASIPPPPPVPAKSAPGLAPVPPPPASLGVQAPAAPLRRAPPGGKMSTGTQVLPDPDELEPL